MKHLLFAVAVLAAPAAAQETAFQWKLQPTVGSRWQVRFYQYSSGTTVTSVTDNEKDWQTARIDTSIHSTHTMEIDVLPRDMQGNNTLRITPRKIVRASEQSIIGLESKKDSSTFEQDPAAANFWTNPKLQLPIIVRITPDWRLIEAWAQTPPNSKDQTNSAFSKIEPNPKTRLSYNQLLEVAPFVLFSGQTTFNTSEIGRGYSYPLLMPKDYIGRGRAFGTRILTSRNNGIASYEEAANIPRIEQNNAGSSQSQRRETPSALIMRGHVKVDEASGLVQEGTINFRTQFTATGKFLGKSFKAKMWDVSHYRLVTIPLP